MTSNDETDLSDLPSICLTRGDQELVDLALGSGLTPAAAEAVASIDAVMHKVRRAIQRREFGRQLMARLDPTLEVAHLDTISAIAHKGDEPAQEVTVGLIAERLGIDPSRASRVVADVVDRGLAKRVASQLDARRICLELTAKGQRFVDSVRRNKLEIFAQALGQWNERELVVFAALFDRFSNWATAERSAERSAEQSAEKIRRILEESEVKAALETANSSR